MMEINIGIMCSCMPALRPFFARVMPRLRKYMSRSRYHEQNTDQLEDGQILDIVERYQSMDANDTTSTERSPTGQIVADIGARNIVAF